MPELLLQKATGTSLIAADEKSFEWLQKKKTGQTFRARVSEMRNLQFQRKYFALLNYAFDAWEPEQKLYKGIPVAKNFDQFRADITILAGFYETAIRLDGSIRITPKSIAFSNMGEEEFSRLYSSVIDVLLQRIFINQTRAEVENVVNNILAYA
ncbi:MAG: DUF1367 family protein [Alistipes senegalensis]|nr:DUF1367 family protein [Oxalobacter formigenes]MCM1280931.1 DUF1367 family protein [Alistipes senegalensis]